jgi:hypothetical protein
VGDERRAGTITEQDQAREEGQAGIGWHEVGAD